MLGKLIAIDGSAYVNIQGNTWWTYSDRGFPSVRHDFFFRGFGVFFQVFFVNIQRNPWWTYSDRFTFFSPIFRTK
jgi:hypothetical protein